MKQKGQIINGRYRVYRPSKAELLAAFYAQAPDEQTSLPTSKCTICGQYNSHDPRCSERGKK